MDVRRLTYLICKSYIHSFILLTSSRVLIKYRASDSGNDKPSCLNHSFIDDSYIIWREYKQKVLKASKSWQEREITGKFQRIKINIWSCFCLEGLCWSGSFEQFWWPPGMKRKVVKVQVFPRSEVSCPLPTLNYDL